MIFTDAAIATTFASLFLAVVVSVFRIRMITPQFLLLFWICASLLGGRGHGSHSELSGDSSAPAAAISATSSFWGRTAAPSSLPAGWRRRRSWVIAFSDSSTSNGGMSATELKTRYPLCCSFDELSEYLRRNVVDEVANYLPLRSFYEHVLADCGLV